MIHLKKILVATDFSAHSENAVRYAVELAKKFEAAVHVLHVVEPTPILYGEGGGYFTPEMVAEVDVAAKKRLADLEIAGADDVPVKREVVTGHPFVEVVRYAKNEAVDLIIVGTHGRGAISHMLLGNVAEKVVRKAPCPVLVVRDEEHEFVMP